jgi:hypothetical protein
VATVLWAKLGTAKPEAATAASRRVLMVIFLVIVTSG